MTILQVLYMIEVTRHRSISKAAEALLVSQPALSLQIKHLEEELGYPLFHRTTQGVSLTKAGTVFYESALPVAESWDRLQSEMKLLGNAACKSMRIAVGARAMSNGLFEAVLAFFEKHQETEVSFVTDLGENPLEALVQNKIDLAIDRMPLDSMISYPEQFSVIELLRERQCILLSPDDPRASCPELPFQTIHGNAIVSGPRNSWDDEIMNLSCQKFGIRVSRVYRADNIDAVMTLIRSGKGAALGPRSFGRRYGVAAVPMLPETEVALNLICLKKNRKHPLLRPLEQFLKTYITQNFTDCE